MRIGSFLSRRKSILSGWLLSYLLILAVPLVVTFVTQARTAAILEREITDAHLIVLKRIRERMDAQVETAWRLTQEIALNPRLAALTRGFTPPPPGGYAVYEMSRDLRTYSALYASIEDLYVYLPRIDSILSSAGLVDTRTYHATYLQERGTPFDVWHREIALARKGDFVLFEPEAAAESGSIVYMQSTPLFVAEPDANVAISLSKSAFVEDARDIATLNGATVVVLDSGDRVIAASAGAGAGFQAGRALRYHDLPEQEGLIRERGASGPVIGSCIVSTLTDWKYVVVVPREVFWRKAEAARRLALAGFLVCVLLGGAVVIVSLKRNYDPVGELVALMERFQGRDFGRGDNEFGFIRRAMAQAEEEREKYGIVVAQQDRTLRENLLRRLLKGALPPGDTLADRLYLHGIRFAGDTFVVAALYIVDYDEAFASPGADDGRDRDAYEEYRKVQLIMAAAFEELLAERGHRGFAVDVDDLLAVLVSLDPATAARWREEIGAVAESAAARLGERVRIHFLTAVSAPHGGIGEIPQAWSEALQTMEYKRLLGIEAISHFDDVAEAHGARYDYPPETERQLINAVRTGDGASAVAIIRGIFGRSFGSGRLSPGVARCLMSDLVSTMLKAMEEIAAGRPAEAASESPADAVERLMACETAQELERDLIALVETRCASVRRDIAHRSRGRHRQGARRLSERVVEEVSGRYTDVGLDISALARLLETNPITLSRVFHEETGEGLLDHINRVRIERAKDLMRESPETPLEEICRRVGYGSSKTFTRAFKRREGVTPGRYKASVSPAPPARPAARPA